MTYTQTTTWGGVAINDVRPGVRARMGQQMLQIAKDQALVFEETTGLKVPLSTTIAATPHQHDGTTGLPIPIPLFHIFIGGVFYPSTGTTVRSNAGWSPVARPIQWIPVGVTKVRCWVSVGTLATLSMLRVRSYDQTLALYGSADFTPSSTVGGVVTAYTDVSVSQGEINNINLEYRTAVSGVVLPSSGDEVFTFSATPYVGAGYIPQPHIVQAANDLSVIVPSSTTWKPSTSGYHSSHDENFADDDAISGYMAHAAAYNDALLFETATGQPYPGKATKTWNGHNHGAATSSASTTSSKGAEIDQPITAVNFGVRRTAVGKTTYRHDADESEVTLANMSGRIWSSQMSTATGTSYQSLGAYPFAMPASLAANIQGGSSRLRFAALADVNASRITTGTVRGTITNASLGASGTSTVLTFSGGLEIVTGAIDFHGASDVAYTGELCRLLIEAARGVNWVASTQHTMAILSACLYYEAA